MTGNLKKKTMEVHQKQYPASSSTFTLFACSSPKYRLNLTASLPSPSSSTAHTMVEVQVEDANEHPPVFPFTSRVAQITEEDDHNLPRQVLQVSQGFCETLMAHSIYEWAEQI